MTQDTQTKTSAAQIAAVCRYNKGHDAIMLRPSKQDGQRIRQAAAAAGQSVQAYILQAVADRMKQDGGSSPAEPETSTADPATDNPK